MLTVKCFIVLFSEMFYLGNPGALEYYIDFIKALYEGLQRTVPIWGVSHAGHVSAPPGLVIPKLPGIKLFCFINC